MKVGDLIKVYDFTDRARKTFRARGIDAGDLDGHAVGLIMHKVTGEGFKVLLCKWNGVEVYSANRLEVIHESR